MIGFGGIRFHDLRGIHSTALLDAGIPVHTAAQRIGDDLAVLLRNHAKRKRTKQVDQNVALAIAAISASFPRTYKQRLDEKMCPKLGPASACSRLFLSFVPLSA